MVIIYLLNAVLVLGLMNPNEAQEINSMRVDRLMELESVATPRRRAFNPIDSATSLGEGFVGVVSDPSGSATSLGEGFVDGLSAGATFVEGWGVVTWDFATGHGSDGINHLRKAGVELADATKDVADVLSEFSFNDIKDWIKDALDFFNCVQPQGCLVEGIEVSGCTPGNSQCVVEYSGSCLEIRYALGIQSSHVLAQTNNAALTVSAKAGVEVTSQAAAYLYLDSRSKVRVELTPPVIDVDAEVKFDLTVSATPLDVTKRVELSTPYEVLRRVFMAGPIPVVVVVTAQPVAILTAKGEATVTGSVQYNARGVVTFQDILWAEINLENMQVNQNFDSLRTPSIDTQFHDFWTFEASGELGVEFGAAVGVELSIAVYETAEFNLFPAVKGSLKTSGTISSKTVAQVKTESASVSGVVNAQASAQFCLNGEVTGYFDWKVQSAGRRELAEIDFGAKITANCETAASQMCPLVGFIADVIPICDAVGDIIASLGFPSIISLPDINFISLSVDFPGTCLASIELSRELVGFDEAIALAQRSIEETTLDNVNCPIDFVGYIGVMSGPGYLTQTETVAISSEQACKDRCLNDATGSTICNTFEWNSESSRCYLYTTGEESINRGIDFKNRICTRIVHTCPNDYRHVAGDIAGWGLGGTRALDEQACAKRCSDRADCKAFQYSANADGLNCAIHLNSNINGPTATDFHMCVRSCRSPSAEIPIGFEFAGNPVAWQNIDYPVSDETYLGNRLWYENAGLRGYRGYPVSLDQCQRACGVTIGCKAFQYDTTWKQCWLLREPRFYPGNQHWTGYTCEEFSQDCEFEWSSCDATCRRPMIILKPKIGAGAECQRGIAPPCNAGQDLCPPLNCATHGSGLCDHPSLNRGAGWTCTGSSCSEQECCEPKASCGTYTSTCAHASLRLGAVQICPGDASTCDDDVCCAEPATCASYQGDCHKKPDNTVCEGATCRFDECCQECVGNRYLFDAEWLNCLTYTEGTTNFGYCATDMDSNQGFYASQVCHECNRCYQPQVQCVGDSTARATWNAGYGLCNTYGPADPDTSDSDGNSAWCHLDEHSGIIAEDICPQCGKCTI